MVAVDGTLCARIRYRALPRALTGHMSTSVSPETT